MKNNDIDKKKIAIIFTVAFAIVIALSLLVSHSLSKHSSSGDSGLLKSAALTEQENHPVRQTEQDRQEEYDNREEMPAITEETFYDTISSFLASGNFDALDETLRHWQETYKDSSDESESKTAVISQYRGDIAYYKSIINSDSAAAPIWQFKTPDTLAAAIAYSPIMKKYTSFVSQDALMIPAVSVGTNISLCRSDKTNEELSEIRASINRNRRDETAFQQIAVYNMTLYDYPCQFIAVMDRNTMSWIPYSIEVTNNMMDLPTVSFGKEIVRSNPNADLDIMIAIPAAISERPEGMEGNINTSDIPSSEDMSVFIAEDTVGPAEIEPEAENPLTAEQEAAVLDENATDPESGLDILNADAEAQSASAEQ